uniref:Reverse transcriptase domain-containing protein n=1 Tax=Amicula sp. isolate GU52X-4 cfCalB7 TaxID=3003489 RepID=A0A9E8YZK6_9STRA|nr:hypothetical protein [Amicula sp. isolate GU52X-4 cfCalB7]
MLVYYQIKNKASNLTSGGETERIVLYGLGLSKDWFQKTALDIQNGTYEFKMNRKTYIPKKSNNNNFRPLIINNPTEKIIQKAIFLVLEEIYENKEKSFSRFSHGFHLNKSYHTAFEQIKNEWTAIPWFVKIDIKNVFGVINRNILISKLKLKIKDQRLFQIILNMFKAKIISPFGILKEKLGVPQNSVLSLILANIYFQSLDSYIEKNIIERYNKCKKAPKLNLRHSKIDDSYIRIKYIRYVDDILIGVKGPKKLAEKVLKIVTFFLKSDLQLFLNEKKSQILNAFSSRISFLGMLLYNVATKKVFFRKSPVIENNKRKHSRIIPCINALNHKQTKFFKNECLILLCKSYVDQRDKHRVYLGFSIQIKADTDEIYNCLIENSIINSKKKPISKTSLFQLEAWLIIRYYNSVAYGLLYYFRGVDNFNTVKKIITYYIRYSLLRTLAHKHKCSSKKILAIYGKKISAKGRNEKKISFISSVEISNIKKKFLVKDIKDPYAVISIPFISL